ncbi:hypothetical protein [uncultured Thiothrix sp.]|jgi:hypothetical protein|uniref:hypothetical protein n=1 Tax=uncultured Thiothrix sp. TaxID=223185 RepID=UPI00261916D4|nr:hypothetical protein [uncultured Thiothrix sp.]HMT92690.1 hypothetical protein [Thiolinea sp.]
MSITPLFALVLVFYLLLHWLGFFPAGLDAIPLAIPMPSYGVMRPTYGDWLVVAGLIALHFEIFKATRINDLSILERIISTLVLIVYLIIWLTKPWAANSYFMLLTLMAFINVAAGFTVTYAAAKASFNISK